MVRCNKYRFRILHIYLLKPITWQPSTIQTDGERQWAERVLCLIGGPRETVYSDCSSLDRRAKMSTSRKPRAKLAERSTAETQASTERGTVAARSALTGTQFVCFCHWLSGQKLFAGLSLFTCTFQSLRRARRAHRDRRRLEPLGHGNAPREPPQQVGRAICLSHSPSEIWPNTLFFSPAVSSLPDYPSDALTSSESSDSEPEEAENLSMGWSERVTRVDTQFHGDHVGPTNIPDHINHESTALSFLELFLDADFWGLLCRQTNLRDEQVKQSKPASYYAKNFRPVAVPELKAFLGLRLQMEKCVIKPRYESYWQGAGHNFIAHTPGFREVMERDRFIALWGFLHVDQTDEAVEKSDKIYKVRPMLDRMLPLFRRYYSPRQQLSLDEGMIPTKNRLAIKQYIRDKPVRWGIKSFLLCEAKTGYILDAEIYTGRVRDRHWPLLGSAGSVVRRLVENSQVTNKNHMLFMDRFYNSVALFHMLKKELGVLAAGTVMPSRKFHHVAGRGEATGEFHTTVSHHSRCGPGYLPGR